MWRRTVCMCLWSHFEAIWNCNGWKRVGMYWLIFGWIEHLLTFSSFKLKRYSIMAEMKIPKEFIQYMMLWTCYNISYEFSIIWLLCGFLAVLTTNGIKMQMRWFIWLWNMIWDITLFFVYARSCFQLYCPLISVNFTNFNCTNYTGIGMYC